MRVPWTARRSNQSILKEIRPGCSLEGLMLKLKLQYFGHLMRRVDSLEKTLMLGRIGGRRRRGQQKMRWLDGITTSMDMSLSELWELVGNGQEVLACCDSWCRKELDTTEQLNRTECTHTNPVTHLSAQVTSNKINFFFFKGKVCILTQGPLLTPRSSLSLFFSSLWPNVGNYFCS